MAASEGRSGIAGDPVGGDTSGRPLGRRRIVVFLVSFVGLCATGLLLLQHAPLAGPMWTLKVSIARIVGWGMSALGCPATTDGAKINFDLGSIQIIDECTGVYATILLLSFILAFPHRWSRKMKAIGIALAFITVTNLARLVALGLLMKSAPDVAKFAHDYLWQVVWGAALVGFVFLFARPDASPVAAPGPSGGASAGAAGGT